MFVRIYFSAWKFPRTVKITMVSSFTFTQAKWVLRRGASCRGKYKKSFLFVATRTIMNMRVSLSDCANGILLVDFIKKKPFQPIYNKMVSTNLISQ